MGILGIAARVASRRFRVGEQVADPPAEPQAEAQVAEQQQTAAPAKAPDQHAVEHALYGHTADTDPHRGEGSSIWWQVFDDMGMADWIPTTDYNAVEKRAWELLVKWQPWKGLPEQKKYFQKSIDGLKRNWQTYQKSYMPEHIKLLKEQGLM